MSIDGTARSKVHYVAVLVIHYSVPNFDTVLYLCSLRAVGGSVDVSANLLRRKENVQSLL